jgi:putative membrane protein
MRRSVVLAGLAAVTAGPAFAQNQSARGSNGSPSPGSAEKQYLDQTMMVGSLSLAISRVADQKARFPRLKEFVRFEIAEQETVADVLSSLENPGAVSGAVKPPSEAQVEGHLDAQGKEMLQKMRSAEAGASFERAYLDAETDGHEKLLHIQEEYLKAGRNLDAINVAKLASGMIKEHLQLLAGIKSDMGAATTGAAPGRRR